MLAVVDTNVLVRAIIKPTGSVGAVLGRLADRRYALLFSEPLLEELVDVLGRPRIRDQYQLGADAVRTPCELIRARGHLVLPDHLVTACRDPKDNKVLEAALAGPAAAIVSADEDLLVLHPFAGIPILRPAALFAMLDAVPHGS